MTSIIDNLLGACLVVVPVIHVSNGILDTERCQDKLKTDQIHLISIFQRFSLEFKRRCDEP